MWQSASPVPVGGGVLDAPHPSSLGQRIRIATPALRRWFAMTGLRPVRSAPADPRFPRRGDLRSPASLRACPTSGPGHGLGAGPYDADGGFPQIPNSEFTNRPYGADGRPPVGSDPQIAPPTRACVRQAGRRGRRPLRCERRFPANSEFRIPNSPTAPTKRTHVFLKFRIPNSP